jgi:hypothetical protein
MHTRSRRALPFVLSVLFVPWLSSAETPDSAFAKWLKPIHWQRDSPTPALGLGDKGKFDDQHIFAPHVVFMDGEYWMYYSGSQRCVDAGTYRGVAKDPKQPEKSDQRLFKVGLAKSKDGIKFMRHSADPIFGFGDEIHSVLTVALLKNPDGSVLRENGRLIMYYATCDFPKGTYKHQLWRSTSVNGLHWSEPVFVAENIYAPCVIKESNKYRMWYTWIDKHPWHTNHAESDDGIHFKITEKPCIVMDQKWEVKDQVYPMVIKTEGVYLMLYGCYWNDDKHTALGFAVSRDGHTWTKHPENPVFRPEPKHDWESNFTTSHTLLRLPDGSFRLWYAGRRQPPWSNLYFAMGTAHWSGPGN